MTRAAATDAPAAAEGLADAEQTASGKMQRKTNTQELSQDEESARGEKQRTTIADRPATREGKANA